MHNAAVLLLLGGLLLFGMAAVPGTLYAQSRTAPVPVFRGSVADIVFQHLNENNGLANPVVTAFAEDGDGFLWVGSQNGLQRWDGYRFWSYKQALGSAASLPDNLVQTLHTDWQGRLWVGTSSGGLAMYDRTHDSFIRYRHGAGDLSGADVFSILGDGGRGLWVGTDTGLAHLDTDTGQFTPVSLAASNGRVPQHASALLRDAQGSLWVGTEQGLQRSLRPDASAPGKTLFQPVPLPLKEGAATQVQVLYLDRAGRVWVGTSLGIYVVDRAEDSAMFPDGTARPVPGPAVRALIATGSGSELLASQIYLSIAETTSGEIWLGTQDEGILAVDPNRGAPWAVRHIGHDDGIPTTLSDDLVYAEHLDRSGVLWIGTRRGISYLNANPRSIFSVLGGPQKQKSIRDTNVYFVLTRPDGSVWLALSHGGVDILDASGKRTSEIVSGTALSDTALPSGAVNGLVADVDGSVLITTKRGLYRATAPILQADGHAAPRLAFLPFGKDASIEISRVLPDAGKLWIGGSNGLWIFDPAKGSATAARPEMQRPLTDQRVTVLMREPAPSIASGPTLATVPSFLSGPSLWIGTQNGLNRLELNTHAVENILPDAADPEALGGGYISSLLTDRKGRLWVGTFSGGIDVLEGRDSQGRPRFHRIIDGLPNENIDTLLEARDGKIWASTDGGLAVIDPDTFEMRILHREDGADLAAYWNDSGAVSAAGDLLFGGIGGLTVVRPSTLKPWTYLPPVVVTNALIGETEIPASRFNSGLAEYPVWIAPNDSNLTVGFAALDYTAPDRNRYEYKLQGFDKNWIQVDSTRRLARYTNLPPGDYTLLLRGSNRDGLWAPTRQIRVRVLPAWFQTWWFRAVAILLALLTVYLLVLLATSYLRRQQHELERQVALRTAELQQVTVDLKHSQQQLEHMAYTDALTGLPNRRMFTEHFKRLLALKRREASSFSVLLMDFDDFKTINDTRGHDAGDFVLVEMAARMAQLVRESDCLARLGGDEFGLLLSQAADFQAAESVCRKIVECFETPVVFEGRALRTSPSIGIAFYPLDGETQDALYKAADLALYQAKRDGGNGARGGLQAAEPLETQ